MSLFKKFLSFIVYLVILASFGTILYLGIKKPIDNWLILLLLLIILLILINMIFCVYIFYSRRSDVRKKVWLFYFSLFPIFTPLIFLWFGYNSITKKDISKFLRKKNESVSHKCFLPTKNEIINNVQKLLMNDSIHNIANGDVEYIEHTEDFYKEIIKIIRNAKKYIILNYFILGDGFFLKTVINELKQKKDQGVDIFFAYDWVWTKKSTPNKIIRKIKKELNLFVFKPKKIITSSKDNNRNHKKYIVVDGNYALYGGSNLSNEYLNLNPKYNYWTDSNFKLSGEIVKNLIDTFKFDFELFIKNKNNGINKEIPIEKKNEKININDNIFLLWDSYPENEISTCMNVYKTIIPFIKKELVISTPYLYPTKELMDLLINARKMGVIIKFLLPSLPDNKKIIVWLNRTLYRQMIENEIEIYETNSFNHAKFWIIDDELTIATSTNFDPRATIINYETSLLIKDKKLNKKMKNICNNNYWKKINKEDLEGTKWKFMIKIFNKISMLIELIL